MGRRRLTDDDRVPLRCASCGAIAPGQIESNGAIKPIGGHAACDCDEPDFTVLEKDDPVDG